MTCAVIMEDCLGCDVHAKLAEFHLMENLGPTLVCQCVEATKSLRRELTAHRKPQQLSEMAFSL